MVALQIQNCLCLIKIFPFVKIVNHTSPCDICFYAKKRNSHFSNFVFDLVDTDTDIWGPLSIPPMIGYKYFLTVLGDKSRFTWFFLMRLKYETSTIIKSLVSMVNTQFNLYIKWIRSNNDSELFLLDFYNQLGIVHQASCVGTLHQNSTVERKHQHILGITRAILFQDHLPQIFWTHVKTTWHLIKFYTINCLTLPK